MVAGVHELDVALQAAEKASEVVLSIYRDPPAMRVLHKSDHSPVTVADTRSHEVIISILQEHFDDAILSEEGKDDSARLTSKRVWVIDPLDGTKEFIKQLDEFAINIALVEDGVPIVGVVAIPAKNEFYYASLGQGAYLKTPTEQRCLNVSAVRVWSESRLSVTRSHLSEFIQDFLEKHPVKERRAMGSALKYCSIAAGETEASIRKTPLMEWDICAPDCVLREAGGLLTDFEGQPFRYNQRDPLCDRGLIASNGSDIHAQVLADLTQCGVE